MLFGEGVWPLMGSDIGEEGRDEGAVGALSLFGVFLPEEIEETGDLLS